MTDPTSRPAPAITNDDGLAPIGAWTVHRAPGHGHEPPIWRGYQTIPPAAPPGLPFAAQVGAMPMAMPPSQMPMGAVAPARAARRSRTADAALVLAAFVATAGVAFAIGRWSAADSPSAAPMQAVSQLPAGVRFPAGAQLPSAVEPMAAAVDEGSTTPEAVAAVDEESTTAGADTTFAEPPAIDRTGDLPAGLPAMGGAQGPGVVAGFGPGALRGTISSIEDGTLALATEDGTIVTVATDASTAYVRDTAIDAAEMEVGDLVSVQVPFAGFPGHGAAGGDASLIAEQVTLLPDPAD